MYKLRFTGVKYIYIPRGKSLAIYFGDSQLRRNRTFNFKVSKIYVDKRSRVRWLSQVDISHNVKSDFMPLAKTAYLAIVRIVFD